MKKALLTVAITLLLCITCNTFLAPTAIATPLPQLKIETSIDTTAAVVKQQLLYSVTVHYNGRLVDPELRPPTIPNVIVLQAGDVEESSSNNPAYQQMATITWALFPLKEGLINIPALNFSALWQSEKDTLALSYLSLQEKKQHVQSINIKTNAITLRVQPDEPRHTLRCQHLSIATQWSKDPDHLLQGETVKYTVMLEANGLPAELLPEITLPEEYGYHALLHNTSHQNISNSKGITGRRVFTYDVTPLISGSITLPSLSIPWWSTEEKKNQSLFLSAQQINVTQAPTQGTNTSYPTSSSVTDYPIETATYHVNKKDNSRWSFSSHWKIVVFLSLLMMVLITWLLASSLKHIITGNHSAKNDRNIERRQWQQLLIALRSDKLYLIRQALRQWLQSAHVQQHLNASLDVQIQALCFKIDKSLYARESSNINTKLIAKKLKAVRKKLYAKGY